MASRAPVTFGLLPDNAGVDDAGALTIAGVPVMELAERYGTPLFIYDEDHIRARCREAVQSFGGGAAYASKAFLCRAVARVAHEEGMMIDVASGGEMYIARSAGIPADQIVMHGNNKSQAELELGMTEGVAAIVIDNFDEIDRIEALHAAGLPKVRAMIRINPGIEVHTDEKIATGVEDSKFGLSLRSGAAERAVLRARNSSAIDLLGVHMHIGSQVFSAENFALAVRQVAPFISTLELSEFVVGGGLGVPYVEGEEAPTISQWSRRIHEECDAAGISARIGAEPGRSLVAQAAITVYRIGSIKELEGIRTYVAVDGGMSDNPRPVLYGSGYETFLPRAPLAERDKTITLVGKHCESGDRLVVDGQLPADVAVGDLVATPVTGAYGHSMGSNYNKVTRPPVVFVSGGTDRLVVRRETFDDLLSTDVG